MKGSINFVAHITDWYGKEIMTRSFDKRWKAQKWADKKIDEHHKIDEWFYEINTVYN